MPSPRAGANSSVPCGSASAGSPDHARAKAATALAWTTMRPRKIPSSMPALALPHGTLEFAPARGEGIATSALGAAVVTVRRREGGERLRIAMEGSPRALKRLLHDAGIAPWQRASLPLVYCGDTLAAVPGIGVDAALRAGADAPGVVVRWHPRHRG